MLLKLRLGEQLGETIKEHLEQILLKFWFSIKPNGIVDPCSSLLTLPSEVRLSFSVAVANNLWTSVLTGDICYS